MVVYRNIEEKNTKTIYRIKKRNKLINIYVICVYRKVLKIISYISNHEIQLYF